MDTPEAKSKLSQLEHFITDEKSYEQGLENIDEDMRPKTKINFKQILTMSAKEDQKSVSHVKNQLRSILDDVEQKQDEESQIQSLTDEIDAILETNK